MSPMKNKKAQAVRSSPDDENDKLWRFVAKGGFPDSLFTVIVAHVGDDVRLVDLAGVGLDPGSFGDRSTTHQTPQWHPTEELVVYTVDVAASSGEVVVQDVADGTVSSVIGFDGFVLFDLDPSGERLAMSTIGGTAGTESPRALRRQAGVPGLSIVDVATGASVSLAEQPTAAPAWDPTGSYVLARDSIGEAGRWSYS